MADFNMTLDWVESFVQLNPTKKFVRVPELTFQAFLGQFRIGDLDFQHMNGFTFFHWKGVTFFAANPTIWADFDRKGE